MEKTLVLIKPDGVKRNIIGKIISRFEDTGLKIIAMKMVHIDEEHAGKHYPLDEEWAKAVFEKTKSVYDRENKPMKYKTHMEWGNEIRKRNMEFLREAPVVAMVLEGPHAIEIVRKIVGHTEPRQALPGTIRGDFYSIESYAASDAEGRSVRNLIHASDSAANAEKEIALWFRPEEIMK
ncbi:MAG TPA: nucleoside-diphosphate kinase [Candidatus Omnitrophota bacterium]|nr:nucleoside-diphosphate kinase [Candidatus Omnitrophota bacterium]